MSGFNIGQTYTLKNSEKNQYYIAISEHKVMSIVDGKPKIYSMYRSSCVEENYLSVEDLCYFWEISPKNLDNMMKKWFQPSASDTFAAKFRMKQRMLKKRVD